MAAPARPVSPGRAALALRIASGGPIAGALLFGLGYWVNFSGKALHWDPLPAFTMMAGYGLMAVCGAVSLWLLKAGPRFWLAVLLGLGAWLLGGVGMVLFRHWLPPLLAMGGWAFLAYQMVEGLVKPMERLGDAPADEPA